MSRLSGKRALITGGTSGIGLETAKRFINEGAKVVVTGVNPETLEKAKAELGPDVLVVKADSASVADQQALAETLRGRFGEVDVAFLNAGVSSWRPIEAFDEESFDRQFTINVKGPFFLVQALLPILAKPASVILNASMYTHAGAPNSSVYTATKAAVLSFAKTLSGELLPRGVRFNAVSAGPVETPLFSKLGIPEAYFDDAMAQIAKTIPAGRFGTPTEIANAVVYLASDESSWTVGAEIIVDGGRNLNV